MTFSHPSHGDVAHLTFGPMERALAFGQIGAGDKEPICRLFASNSANVLSIGSKPRRTHSSKRASFELRLDPKLKQLPTLKEKSHR